MSYETPTSADARLRWSLGISWLLHVVVCVFVLSLPAPPDLKVLEEATLDVEIVDPSSMEQEAEKRTARTTDSRSEAIGVSTPPVRNERAAQDLEPPMVKPSRMMSGDVLAHARSREAREELAKLARSDQVEQLCGLEAMAQVSAWSAEIDAEYVRAWAIADPLLSGSVFSADGAALQSKRKWYRLQFKCFLTPDYSRVTGFEFRLGDLIPQRDWPRYNLHDEYEEH
ncbi:DUF930 domain-containing protein [Rhizobium favelukesii]|nr:DUF930 domain-containing protein [Rhizobium favelukesii]MCS0461150.1 DUF930 domain-containing protein [Rhizobium favelukesii]